MLAKLIILIFLKSRQSGLRATSTLSVSILGLDEERYPFYIRDPYLTLGPSRSEEYLPTHISLDALCQRYPQQRLPYPLVLKILRQLVSVVRDGLHSHQVVHRDIKPGVCDPKKWSSMILALTLVTL